MNKIAKQKTIAHQSVEDVDYLLWALSTVRRAEVRQSLPINASHLDRRALRVATELSDLRGLEKLELLQLAACCHILGAEVKLAAVPCDESLFGYCMPLLEHAKLSARDHAIIDVQPQLGDWLKRICAAYQHDALAWGSGTSVKAVRQILQGEKSAIDAVGKLLAAADHQLRVWIAYKTLDVGSTEFQRCYPQAGWTRYQSLCARKLRRRVSSKTFWSVLMGDMA